MSIDLTTEEMGALGQLLNGMGELPAAKESVATAVNDADMTKTKPWVKRSLRVYKETISTERLSKRDLRAGQLEFPVDQEVEERRPKTYGDCEREGLGEPGNPCPWALCPYNLFLDVSEKTGAIILNFPGKDFDEIPETCALHVANHVTEHASDQGTLTLDEIGRIMNLTRERIRQVERISIEKIKQELHAKGIATGDDEEEVRRLWQQRRAR